MPRTARTEAINVTSTCRASDRGGASLFSASLTHSPGSRYNETMVIQGDSRPRAGFTLLELLMALVVISVVASFAIPAWFERGVVTLDNAARLMAQDLRDAQNRAAFQGREIRVVFDEGGYRVIDTAGDPLIAPIGSGPFQRSYPDDATFEGVVIERIEFGSDRTLHYDSSGTVAAGGSVLLRFREDARVVSVQSGVGLIEIQGLAKPWEDADL